MCRFDLFFGCPVTKRSRHSFLADELVEMCCKALALAANPNLGNIQFPTLLAHPAVQLPAQTVPLGGTLLAESQNPNPMQHGQCGIHCRMITLCDAILDAVAALEHCFPGTLAVLPDALKVGSNAWSGFTLARRCPGYVAHSRTQWRGHG